MQWQLPPWLRSFLPRPCPSRSRAEGLLQERAPSSTEAAHPSEGTASKSSTVVSADAIPGVTKVQFNADGRGVNITIPKAARAGDILTLSKEAASGEWRLDIKRAPGTCRGPNKVRAFVPGDAIPGETEVHVDTLDGNRMTVTVPGGAQPGNLLLLTRGGGDWKCNVVDLQHSFDPPDPRDSENEVAAYLALRDRACTLSAKWSPHLMRRPATQPDEIAGIIALADYAAGAELGRVPQSQFLTREAIRAVAPDFSAAVEALLPLMPADQRSLPLQVAYLTKLLVRAEARAGLQIRPLFATEGHPLQGVDLDALWNGYADAIAGELLPDHPYRWALKNPVEFRRAMSPSPEGPLVEALAAGVLIRYEVLTENLGYDHLGAAFSAERFLRAWLLTISRSFELEGARETMIPHMDGFNHAAKGKENARVRWDAADQSMVVEATGAIAAGEEIFFFYDANSNPVLFRTYGFTCPPWEEAKWTVLSPPLTSQVLLREHFPAGSPWRGKMIELCSDEVHSTLWGALEACQAAGGDASKFLSALVDFRLEPYQQDEQLKSAVTSVSAGAKEAEGDAADLLASLDSPGRVKLSECLCLMVHREALRKASSSPAEPSCASVPVTATAKGGVHLTQMRERYCSTVLQMAEQLREVFKQLAVPVEPQ